MVNFQEPGIHSHLTTLKSCISLLITWWMFKICIYLGFTIVNHCPSTLRGVWLDHSLPTCFFGLIWQTESTLPKHRGGLLTWKWSKQPFLHLDQSHCQLCCFAAFIKVQWEFYMRGSPVHYAQHLFIISNPTRIQANGIALFWKSWHLSTSLNHLNSTHKYLILSNFR